jgi:hypothetical protein
MQQRELETVLDLQPARRGQLGGGVVDADDARAAARHP